jgi:histidinol-phosphate phosphatase family protein
VGGGGWGRGTEVGFSKVDPIRSKVAFLDRDGTIIEDKVFLGNPDEIEFFPGAIQAIKILRKSGYKIVVISNQSGIGRGILTKEMVKGVNECLLQRLKEKDAPADALYFCPHHPDDSCDCRKPKTGMIKKAVTELKLDLKNAVVIGDHLCDIQLGKNIGAKTVLVLTGHGKKELDQLENIGVKPDLVAKDLLDAANWVKNLKKYEA